MQEENKQKSSLVNVLIATLVFVLIALVTRLIGVTVVLLALPGVYVFAKHGLGWGAAFLAAFVACVLLLFGASGLPLLLVFLPGMILSGVAVRKKLPALKAMAFSCGGILLGLALLMLYIFFVYHTDVITYLAQTVWRSAQTDANTGMWLYSFHQFQDVLSGRGAVQTLFTLPTQTEVQQFLADSKNMEAMRTQLLAVVPGLGVLFSYLTGLLQYLWPRYQVKKEGVEVARLATFDQWYLPKSLSIYFIITYVLAIAVQLLELEQFLTAAVVLYNVVAIPFTIQALSLLDYLLRFRIGSKGVRALVEVVVFLLLSNLLIIVGLFEQIFPIRRKDSWIRGA